MNVSLYVSDYYSSDQFINVLEDALSTKGRRLRKKTTNSLKDDKEYEDLLADYLYYQIFELTSSDTSYTEKGTFDITVSESGGAGAYYLEYGNKRKPANDVNLKVFPPDNLYVNSVSVETSGGIKLTTTELSSDIFRVTMPSDSINMAITYGGSFTKSTIYWGIHDTTVLSEADILAGGTVFLPDGNTDFEIEFNNSSSEDWGYIWIAAPITVEKQEITIDSLTTDQAVTNTTFYEKRTINEIDYYSYIHKWVTGVEALTFKTTEFTEVVIEQFECSKEAMIEGVGTSVTFTAVANKDLKSTSIKEVKLAKFINGVWAEDIYDITEDPTAITGTNNTNILFTLHGFSITEDTELGIKVVDETLSEIQYTVYSNLETIEVVTAVTVVSTTVAPTIVYSGANTFTVTVKFNTDITGGIFSSTTFGDGVISNITQSADTLTFTATGVTIT